MTRQSLPQFVIGRCKGIATPSSVGTSPMTDLPEWELGKRLHVLVKGFSPKTFFFYMQMNWGNEISGYSLNKRDFAVPNLLSPHCSTRASARLVRRRNTVANLHRCPHIYLTAKRRLVSEQKYAESTWHTSAIHCLQNEDENPMSIQCSTV
jgi:hypothetical protein